MTTPNTTTIDEILLVPFMYGIQSELLSDFEARHRAAGFKHTKVYKEAKAALNTAITQIIGGIEPNQYGGIGYTNKKDHRNALRNEQLTRLKAFMGETK